MSRIKTLSDVYVRPQTLSKGSTVYLKLHILSSQIERLMFSKRSSLQRVKEIDETLSTLKSHYLSTKKNVEQIEEENEISDAEE